MSNIPDRILENDFIALKRCKHGIFAFNRNDSFVGRSLDIYGEWCESEMALFDKIVPPKSLVIDVGANIGTHTVFLAKKVGIGGRVLAFEPQRLVYQTLCANVALNALTNVNCVHVAIGDNRESITVPLLNPRAEFNFGELSLLDQTQGETVSKIRIDDLALPRCALIKMDVEGMEIDVIRGATKTITTHHPLLFVENNRPKGSPELVEALSDLGYKCWWHIASYFNPNNFFQNERNIFSRCSPEANMLCIHESRSTDINLPMVLDKNDNWVEAYKRTIGQKSKALPIYCIGFRPAIGGSCGIDCLGAAVRLTSRL